MRDEKVHIFDIDHTLIKESTASCFLREGLKRRVFSVWHLFEFPLQWLRYRIGTLEKALEDRELLLLRRMTRETFQNTARGAFDTHGKALLYREGLDLIGNLKKEGRRVVFATSSFDFLVEPLAEYFEITELISSRLEVKDGFFTGKFEGPVILGDKKREAVMTFLAENNIPPDRFVFYSDSHNDLPLLRECAHPVAVNPDRRLRREAKERGWEIRDFQDLHG